MPSLDGLSFYFSAKYTAPLKMLVNSSKKSLLNVMWHVAPKSSNQSFFQETSEALKNSLVTQILQCATT